MTHQRAPQDIAVNRPRMPLNEAADVLESLPAGRVPDRSALLSAALIVGNLCHRDGADRALKDAAAGLETLATSGTLDLDVTGRARAAKLAALVRAQAVA